jgi:hypothetical protein
MPETLGRVEEQLTMIDRLCPGPVTLLVVPGKAWTAGQIDRLRVWHDQGHALAGHGWSHRAAHIRGIRHRLHSLFVSRDCAEHLALDSAGIIELMTRNRGWFTDHDLPAPELYVPPAWALGRVRPKDLTATGFSRVETMSGYLDVATGRFEYRSLVGFEAASAWQIPVLKLSNAVNGALARWWPLRVALHPDDHRLPLAGDLVRRLERSAA